MAGCPELGDVDSEGLYQMPRRGRDPPRERRGDAGPRGGDAVFVLRGDGAGERLRAARAERRSRQRRGLAPGRSGVRGARRAHPSPPARGGDPRAARRGGDRAPRRDVLGPVPVQRRFPAGDRPQQQPRRARGARARGGALGAERVPDAAGARGDAADPRAHRSARGEHRDAPLRHRPRGACRARAPPGRAVAAAGYGVDADLGSGLDRAFLGRDLDLARRRFSGRACCGGPR